MAEAVAAEKAEAREGCVRRQTEKYERLAEYALDDENRQRYAARAAEWENRLANGGESGIMQSGSGKMTIRSIDSPIEQRHTGKGKPAAITHYDVELNNRQQRLLEQLPEFDSRITVQKDDVSMVDLSAMTAKTGDEFAVFTKGGERLVIRGSNVKVQITVEEARELAAKGYTWSGHTHPGTGFNCLQASKGDMQILGCFDQERSVIYNSVGEHLDFWKG